jgi:hypothetical protein
MGSLTMPFQSVCELINKKTTFCLSGRTEAAMTSSMMVFLSLGSGPLVAILVKQFGHRNIALIGEQSFLL